jgi:signal transduction histidine kinase
VNRLARAVAVAATLTVVAWPARAIDLLLERGAFLHDAASQPPPASAPGWEPVALPDSWNETRPAASGLGWYRLPFRLDVVPREPVAVLLDHVSMNAAVFVNGVWIGQEGRLAPPVSQNWNRPLLFAAPSALLRAGDNVLEIHLYRLPDCYGGLGPVRFGDFAQLAPVHARSLRWRVAVALATTVLGSVFAAVMVAFWIGSRDAAYLWFAVVCVLLSINTLNFHVRDIPVASQVWEAFVCAAAALAAPAFVLFAHRLGRRRHPTIERLLIPYAAAALALFAVDHRYFHPLFNTLGGAALGLCLWAAFVIAHATTREDRTTAIGYALVAFVAIAMLAHDFARQVGWLAPPGRHLTPWLTPLLVVGFGGGLTRRFIQAFREAENRRDLLALRVAEKHAELETQFGEVRALERERLLARERERIMREMHDGVGGQLVRTLSMIEGRGAPREEVASALRDALDDMRLVIDSLDPSGEDLTTRLGMLRARLERTLLRGGVELTWRVDPLPSHPALGTEASLHVVRFVQEAVTNALRHAAARTITIAAREQRAEDRALSILVEVIDDGVGLGSDAAPGRGLANMQRRADLLGAHLERVAGPGGRGTRVSLRVPVSPGAE